MDSVFHRYDDWPTNNSTLKVPRLTMNEARAYIAGCDLIEERGVTGGPRDYVIREYRHLVTGEFRYLGGVFTGW